MDAILKLVSELPFFQIVHINAIVIVIFGFGAAIIGFKMGYEQRRLDELDNQMNKEER